MAVLEVWEGGEKSSTSKPAEVTDMMSTALEICLSMGLHLGYRMGCQGLALAALGVGYGIHEHNICGERETYVNLIIRDANV